MIAKIRNLKQMMQVYLKLNHPIRKILVYAISKVIYLNFEDSSTILVLEF